MKLARTAVLLSIMSFPTFLFAQGSGSTAPRPRASDSSLDYPSETPFAVTRSVSGKILQVDTKGNTIVVEDAKGKRYQFKIQADTKFKADKKTELQHRKNIALGDLETGQFVQITYLASNNAPTEVRLRREKR